MSVLPWQQDMAEHLTTVLKSQRLPHALLIRSPVGWGEIQFANWLALTLLEVDPEQDARLLAHQDLRWIGPDGAVIKVDEIRQLAAFAVGTRQSAPRKVVVVEQAELMNVNAANALLKTLEEPPPDTHIILTSTRPGRLLPTIVSRCQSMRINPDPIKARAWLAQRWSEADIADKMFEYADAPISVDEALAARELSLAPMLAAIAETRTSATQHAKEMLQMDTERLTMRWYRYCSAMLAGNRPIPGIPMIDKASLAEFVDELQSARRQMMTTNSANTRLLLERLVARWKMLIS